LSVGNPGLRVKAAFFALSIASSGIAVGQTFEVSGHVDLVRRSKELSRPGSAEVVVWLTPLGPNASVAQVKDRPAVPLSQKDKQFSPHLLVIPVGSSVDFPNMDPFFHNVFSLFNGKRFDLGLYEGHTHRSVQFDREGVSYIFCNIHPDMGAVVVSLKTPYYAVSTANGAVSLHGVPQGRYRLNVWAENAPVARLSELSRIVDVDPQHTDLGTLHVETSGDTMRHHTNKFGESYKPLPTEPY
jgi:plastocyanin